MEGSHPRYPCSTVLQPRRICELLARIGSSSVLNLHVWLIRLVNNVRSLLIDHLVLTMLRVHHGDLAGVIGLRRITWLRTNLV
jgi:hypothetical protein